MSNLFLVLEDDAMASGIVKVDNINLTNLSFGTNLHAYWDNIVYKISTRLYNFIFYITGSISYSYASSNDISISLYFSNQPIGSNTTDKDKLLIGFSNSSSNGASASTNMCTIALSNFYYGFAICLSPTSDGYKNVSGVNVNFNVYYI